MATVTRRYKKIEMTEATIATRASTYSSASAAAVITPNLAMKPAVNGTPAWASSSTVNTQGQDRAAPAEAPVGVEGLVAARGLADHA